MREQHTDRQTYRHTYRHTDIQTDRHSERHSDIQRYRHTDSHTDIQTDIQTHRRTFRHTDIQTSDLCVQFRYNFKQSRGEVRIAREWSQRCSEEPGKLL